MALTIKSLKPASQAGGLKFRLVSVDMSASYPTGGELVNLGSLGIRNPVIVLASHKAGYLFAWDYTNSKLQAYQQGAAAGALTEVANAVNLSAVKDVRLLIFYI